MNRGHFCSSTRGQRRKVDHPQNSSARVLVEAQLISATWRIRRMVQATSHWSAKQMVFSSILRRPASALFLASEKNFYVGDFHSIFHLDKSKSPRTRLAGDLGEIFHLAGCNRGRPFALILDGRRTQAPPGNTLNWLSRGVIESDQFITGSDRAYQPRNRPSPRDTSSDETEEEPPPATTRNI